MRRFRPDWQPPISTASLVENLSAGRDQHLSWEVEQLALRRLVDTRICELCGASYGQLCVIYAGPSTLRRTHPIRLRMTRPGRTGTVRWAVREAAERAAARAEADPVEDEEVA